MIGNGVLQECDRHDMDSCEFNCNAGHTKSASLIECSKGQWNVADPCIIQRKFITVLTHKAPPITGSRR